MSNTDILNAIHNKALYSHFILAADNGDLLVWERKNSRQTVKLRLDLGDELLIVSTLTPNGIQKWEVKFNIATVPTEIMFNTIALAIKAK